MLAILMAFPSLVSAQVATDAVAPGLENWSAVVLTSLGLVVLAAYFVRRRLRLRRRDVRRGITGLRNGARFRAVDAMAHALSRNRVISEARLARAVEIARDTTEMDFTADHLAEMAARADKFILPGDFRWMREGLDKAEKLVIFNSVAAVMLADRPILRRDRGLLRAIASGLGLKSEDLRDLIYLTET